MSARALYLDRSPGERRGAVYLDGHPERLLIEREGDPERARAGEVRRGRVRSLSKAFRGAFVDLGLERDGLMKLDAAAQGLSEGASVEVEVLAEGRADKGPTLRFRARSEGPPALLQPGPTLEQRLQVCAPGAAVVEGPKAREAADLAEEVALASRHLVGRGATVTIEPARALVAIDVDLGDAGAGHRKSILEANRLALRETARLLRLKSLGGLIVIDLAGPAREHELLLRSTREAFAADEPDVVYAGISRLGVLEIAKPWRERPLSETLCDREGRLSARTVAMRLLRDLEREGRADPGARLEALAAPDVAEEAGRWIGELGPRFSVRADLGRDRLSPDIRPL
jgi:Ribonuclease G/E